MSSNVHPTSHFHPVNNVFIKRPPHPTDKGWSSERYVADRGVNAVPIVQPISLCALQFIFKDPVIEVNELGSATKLQGYKITSPKSFLKIINPNDLRVIIISFYFLLSTHRGTR
jgi:hypothetical protein